MKKSKIILSSGGLGNQLFIIWHAFCLSFDKDLNIYINTFLHNLNYKKTPSYTFLKFYKYLGFLKNIKQPNFFLKIFNLLLLLLAKIIKNKNDVNYQKKRISYSKSPIYSITLNNTANEFGYYQTFIDYPLNKDKLEKFRKIFWDFFNVNDYKQNISIIYENKNRKLENSEVDLAMHVRRGDYKNLEYKMLLLDINFFKNALNKLSNNKDFFNKLFKITIFTDSKDKEELKELIDLLKTYLKISFIYLDNSKPLNSFLHMSKSQVFLISNSTFSLWSSLLAKNSTLIYVPKQWQNDISIYDIGLDLIKKIIPVDIV